MRPSPSTLALNPATNRLYVTHFVANSVSVIDGATQAIDIVPTGPGPYGAAVNVITNKIYIPNNSGDGVTVIDGASNATRVVAAGTGPGALAVNPSTNRIYVTRRTSNLVTVIDGAAGNVPISDVVVEFYHAGLDHYFITADPNEAAAIDGGGAGSGWVRTANVFKSGGDVAVCRFYGSPYAPGPNSHFYTADRAECDGLRQMPRSGGARWNFESLDFSTTLPSRGACPAGLVPVYRAYNDGFRHGRDSNHRITANPAAIEQVVARGWIEEGVVMCAPA